MESYWLRSMAKEKKKKRSRRAEVQWPRQAGASGEETRRTRRRWREPGTAAGMKFRELQGLVPGGEGLGADRLLLRTAGYILHLRRQVHLLRALSDLYQP